VRQRRTDGVTVRLGQESQATTRDIAAPAADPRSEAALLRAAKRGSAEAIEALVKRHWPDARRAAYLVVQDAGVAEDVAQEAMVAAVGAIATFDRRRPFRPWLHRIVVNRSIDVVRARQRRAEVATDPSDWTEQADETSFPADVRLPDELLDALASLTAEDRALVVMRHLLDYRASDIARSLDIPPATVRTRLRRALEVVRTHLEETHAGGQP
jgi:RNA polymerase sigma-70 factor, ECF subfamily